MIGRLANEKNGSLVIMGGQEEYDVEAAQKAVAEAWKKNHVGPTKGGDDPEGTNQS